MATNKRRKSATKGSGLEAVELRDLILGAVDDLKGGEPVVLDVSAMTEVTDYMIIVSGSSARHVAAIVDNVLSVAKARGIEVLGVEGRDNNDWVLIDLADVVVHVMRAATRAFFELERLWETLDAPVNSGLHS